MVEDDEDISDLIAVIAEEVDIIEKWGEPKEILYVVNIYDWYFYLCFDHSDHFDLFILFN